jgi:hypothetical protein
VCGEYRSNTDYYKFNKIKRLTGKNNRYWKKRRLEYWILAVAVLFR